MAQATKTPKDELTRTTVMIPRSTRKKLEELADAGDRPLSHEIRRALERYVEKAAA